MSNGNNKTVKAEFQAVVHCDKNSYDENSDVEMETAYGSLPSPISEPIITFEPSESEDEIDDDEWSKSSPKAPSNSFRFNKKVFGILSTTSKKYSGKRPYDLYCMFLHDQLLQQMVDATNEYAQTCILNNSMLNTWIQPWKDTNIDEMRKFIGIIMWMGLVQYPTLNSYWSQDPLYNNSISSELSRSKFQLLMYMWRFSKGDEKTLEQIEPLLSELKSRFQEVIVPQEVFNIEKSFIPFEHRNGGLNLLTLNLKGGFIYDFEVNFGKEYTTANPNHVMNLIEGLLDRGRTLCANDNFTTLSLANRLLSRKTHLIGPIRPTSRQIPASIIKKKLIDDEVYTEITKTGVSLQKYMLPIEQYLLTTRRTANLKDFHRLQSIASISDKLKSTNTTILKNFNWYQKLAIELLVNVCLVNACYLYRKICTKKISSTRFKEEIVHNLLKLATKTKKSQSDRMTDLQNELKEEPHIKEHKLIKRIKKARCVSCYERISSEFGGRRASDKGRKVNYECNACSKFFCIECFFDFHEGTTRRKKKC